MCERWSSSFANFLADMGPRPAGTTIDRINNDGEDNRKLTYKGRTQTLAQWAVELGLKPAAIYWRAEKGWPDHECIEGRAGGPQYEKAACTNCGKMIGINTIGAHQRACAAFRAEPKGAGSR